MKTLKAKSAAFALTLLFVSPALTACDPPMPPELIAQLAEQTVACESGDVAVASDVNLAEVVTGWADSLMTACQDPAMTLTAGSDFATSPIVLTSDSVAPCTAFASVPVGYDAAVLAFQVEGQDALALSAENVGKILNGEITNWNDQAFIDDNPDITLPDEPIVIRAAADTASVKAVTDFLALSGQSLSRTFETSNLSDPNLVEPLSEGEIAVIPASVSTALATARFDINTGAVDADGFPLLASPEADGIYSAGTQLVADATKSSITAKLDPTIEPKSVFEGETAATPYQLIFPINLYACGEDNLLTRAVATFLLRLDSQGSLTGYNFGQVPESIRLSAVGIVREGLPLPTEAPADQ